MGQPSRRFAFGALSESHFSADSHLDSRRKADKMVCECETLRASVAKP